MWRMVALHVASLQVPAGRTLINAVSGMLSLPTYILGLSLLIKGHYSLDIP